MKKLTLLVLLIAATTYAQETSETQPFRWVFKMSPQHLTSNILKAGVEKLNKTRTSSITLMLNAMGNNKDQRWDYNTYNERAPYNGAGLELNFRKYLNSLNVQQSPKDREFYQSIYFSGFLQGGYYAGDFSNFEYVWDGETQSNIEVERLYKEKIQNYAAGFSIGIQRTLWKVLVVDGYIGAGYQLSNIKTTGDVDFFHNYYYQNPTITSPRYFGILPKVGLMIGVTL